MNFLRRLALLGGGKKPDDSSRLDVEIAGVPEILPRLFPPGRANDLSAPRYEMVPIKKMTGKINNSNRKYNSGSSRSSN